ncbi:MAG: hypothetical protein JJE51_02795, partial [Thermoanaerobaculia bacterium]|nr:hypothetical protein [Thermoanaerobaculia bacterium]
MSVARRFRRSAIATAALVYVILVTLIAILAPALAPLDPDAVDIGARLMAPSSTHWLGTD